MDKTKIVCAILENREELLNIPNDEKTIGYFVELLGYTVDQLSDIGVAFEFGMKLQAYMINTFADALIAADTTKDGAEVLRKVHGLANNQQS